MVPEAARPIAVDDDIPMARVKVPISMDDDIPLAKVPGLEVPSFDDDIPKVKVPGIKVPIAMDPEMSQPVVVATSKPAPSTWVPA